MILAPSQGKIYSFAPQQTPLQTWEIIIISIKFSHFSKDTKSFNHQEYLARTFMFKVSPIEETENTLDLPLHEHWTILSCVGPSGPPSVIHRGQNPHLSVRASQSVGEGNWKQPRLSVCMKHWSSVWWLINANNAQIKQLPRPYVWPGQSNSLMGELISVCVVHCVRASQRKLKTALSVCASQSVGCIPNGCKQWPTRTCWLTG